MTSNNKTNIKDIKSILASTLKTIDERAKSDGFLLGVSTGYDELDEKTSGLKNGDLIIVAGRPALGKTTFSMNLAKHIAINTTAPVVIFNMDTPSDLLMMSMLASHSQVPLNNIRSGNISDKDWLDIATAVEKLGETKLFIDNTPALSPEEIHNICQHIVNNHGDIGLIVIDTIQLMQSDINMDNGEVEIYKISRSLKRLAKKLDCPVIALSELNNSLELRSNKRPIISDLPESNAIKLDADTIMFIYRDEVYNEYTDDKGIAEVIIRKQRNGTIGTVRLTFTGKFTRFDNYIPDVTHQE